jgi:hypothetical protein
VPPANRGHFCVYLRFTKFKPKQAMKRIAFLTLAFATMITWSFAQDKPASPKAETSGKIGAATVKIVYCQPSARGRKVVGGLVPYGEVWRTGANEATTIEFDKPVKIEGKDLAAGKYALFTIPGENEWTVIFNSDSKQWGAYNYKDKDDVLRVNVKPTKTPAAVETFNIAVVKDEVVLKWENTAVAFKVKG